MFQRVMRLFRPKGEDYVIGDTRSPADLEYARGREEGILAALGWVILVGVIFGIVMWAIPGGSACAATITSSRLAGEAYALDPGQFTTHIGADYRVLIKGGAACGMHGTRLDIIAPWEAPDAR